MALPGPLSPSSVPAHRTARAAFDLLIQQVLESLEHHFAAEPHDVEIVVEEAPLLPREWTDEVPTSIVVARPDSTRIVLFRLPIVHAARSRIEREELVWTIILDRLAEVWQVPPESLDPRPPRDP